MVKFTGPLNAQLLKMLFIKSMLAYFFAGGGASDGPAASAASAVGQLVPVGLLVSWRGLRLSSELENKVLLHSFLLSSDGPQ